MSTGDLCSRAEHSDVAAFGIAARPRRTPDAPLRSVTGLLTLRSCRFSILSPVGNGELSDIAERIRMFARARDWERFHTPKNLAASVAIEAAELQEVFQWLSDEQSQNLSRNQIVRAREEIADVAIYLIRLADRLGVDLGEAILEKLAANGLRYPADSVRGISDKRP